MSDFEEMYLQALAASDDQRITAFQERLSDIHANLEEDRKWITYCISNLYKANIWEFSSFIKLASDQQHDIPAMSWRCRNLFEINLWIFYVCESEENLRKFFEDRSRDAFELTSKSVQHLQANASDADRAIDIRERQLAQASLEKIDLVEEKYIGFQSIARKIGYLDIYSLMNKFLSKFAHPSAYRLLTPVNEEQAKPMLEQLKSLAAMYYRQNFEHLEEYLFNSIKLTYVAAS